MTYPLHIAVLGLIHTCKGIAISEGKAAAARAAAAEKEAAAAEREATADQNPAVTKTRRTFHTAASKVGMEEYLLGWEADIFMDRF